MGKKSKEDKKNSKGKKKPMSHRRWVTYIVIWSIILGGSISLLSDALLKDAGILVAFIILIFIILFGVTFDTIGTAVTAANEVPFNAMAAKKVPGAKIAVKMVKNADKVSNFCNDVIGDICGIVSGSASALISNKILGSHQYFASSHINTIISLVIGALVVGGTVGGKALGKNIAINHSNTIIFKVAKIIHFIKKD